jgi:4-hydroxy-tetrahydrodipicolinate synthase
MNTLKGLGVALVTPFKDDFEVDYAALSRILDHLYATNTLDYIVVLGSTGEAATLSAIEKQAILTFVKEQNKDRLPLVFGHSGNNTKELVDTLSNIDTSGYTAILSASPAYVKPTQGGIIAHYQSLADNSPLPIILYNVPSRTSSHIDAETIITLAKHKNIIGVKEASGDLLQAMQINANTSETFLLISGDDMLTIPLFAVGATGLISVLANAYPAIFKEIISSCRNGKYATATAKAAKLLRINDLMYQEGNPAGIKQVLAHMGLCQPTVRLPLVKASAGLSEEIKNNLV